MPASALIDLRAKDNTLSLFEVSEHIDPERIVVAVAVGKQSADDIGYAIFDGDPAASGIQITKVPGTTPDMAVNALHRDLQQLTAQNIADLAALIGSGETRTMLRGRLLALVDAGAAAGHLDRAKLKQKWAINAAGHR